MKELRQTIAGCLKANGADLVGFGGMERFEEPFLREMMPGAKTVICAAFRVLRGAHRGIEDGTTYYQYATMGVEAMEENVMPLALLRACALLEDAGYSALPQRRHQTVMRGEEGTNPEVDFESIMHGRKTEPEMDFDRVAVRCGLGEIGLHGGLLTAEYGPLVRLCAIVTDAALESDPIAPAHLCDRCGACLRACPGGAIDENGQRDAWQCTVYYHGANMHKNPFLPPEAFGADPQREEILAGRARLSPERAREVIRQIIYYPPVKHGYAASICGRACHRACYVHLEENGKLNRRFVEPLRRRPEWELPML